MNEGRKTEATLAHEVFKKMKPNSQNMKNITAHNSGPWPRREIIPPPNESTHQDLIGATCPKDVGSSEMVVISDRR